MNSYPGPEWRPPPPHLSLRPGEVHVWLAGLAQTPARLAEFRRLLCEEETTKAARFLQPRDRDRAVVGRGLLRKLIGKYLDVEPGGLRFRYNGCGKPGLESGCVGSPLEFNVSHSHDFVLLAFTRQRTVGVDIEHVRTKHTGDAIARRYFAPAEVVALSAVPSALQVAAFFECWTRKEAYLKARGDGLSRPLDSFEVAFGPGVVPAIRREDDPPDPPANWTVVNPPSVPDCAAAVVVEGRAVTASFWRWPD
jgi:4'-phosphopantetheinyl transferase